jgi:hypothetical protein
MGNGLLSGRQLVRNEENIYYVGKHGNDANSGRSISDAVLTITQAIALAVAQTPAIDNQFTIYCRDSGEYTESFTLPSWCNLDMADAGITGNIIISDNSTLYAGRITLDGATTAISKTAGAGIAHVNIEQLLLTTGANGVLCTSGSINIFVKYGSSDTGYIIGALTSDHVHFVAKTLLVSGAGIAIGLGAAGHLSGTVSTIEALAGTALLCAGNGDIDLVAGTIEASVAYNIASGSILQCNCADLVGTRTAPGGAIVQVSKAGMYLTEANLTADVGSAQLSGQIIAGTQLVEVAVCANANDCITLPPAVAGYTINVRNNGAQVLDIFPFTSDQIDDGGVNVALALASGASVQLSAIDDVDWYSI